MTDDLRDRIASVLIDAAEFRGVYQLHNPDMKFLANAVIEVLDTDYVLVPKSHTIVRWRQADQPPEGVFRHEVISEWAADE